MDDVVHTVGEAEEHGHDEREKEVGRNVKGRGEIVNGALRVAQNHAGENGEQRGLEDRGEEVGAVAEFAEKRTAEQHAELPELLARPEAIAFAGFRQGLLRLRCRFAW